MFRAAFSHDVVEVHDMSTGLYDDRGCLIGQTWLGATGHTGVMPVYGRNLLQSFPAETVRPGDVYICNAPWICNGQTADVFITTPAFRGERLIGFSINSVHHVDIGGRKGSGLSEEVYEEGLIIPPLELYDDGAPNEQLFAILRRNVRFAEKMIGDLRAQVAAGWAGSRELARLAAEPQTLAVTVRIKGSDVYADFTGTSAQVRHPVNCPINYTRAYVALPLKLVCDPILPNNQGTYEPLHLSVPEGTLLNPTYPAACFWRLSAGMLVSELMFRVLSRITPDRVPADSGSMPTWQFYVNGVRPNGEAFALHQHAFGGMGGRPGDDGLASGGLSLQRARRLHRVVGDGDAGALRGARAHRGLGRGRGVPGRSRSGADSAGVRRAGEEGRAAGAVRLGGADALSPAGPARRRGRLVRGDRGERGGDCAVELAERDFPRGRRGASSAAGWRRAWRSGTAPAGAHRGGSGGWVRDAGRGAPGLRVQIGLGGRVAWRRFLVVDGAYSSKTNSPRFHRVAAPTQAGLERLLRAIATRVARALEKQGLLLRDDPIGRIAARPDVFGGKPIIRDM